MSTEKRKEIYLDFENPESLNEKQIDHIRQFLKDFDSKKFFIQASPQTYSYGKFTLKFSKPIIIFPQTCGKDRGFYVIGDVIAEGGEKKVIGAISINSIVYPEKNINADTEQEKVIYHYTQDIKKSPHMGKWLSHIKKSIEITNIVYPHSMSLPFTQTNKNLAMETYVLVDKVPGKDLLKYTSKKNISFSEQLLICGLLAEKIEILHDNGIIHRDIKPDNIMYASKNPEIKEKLKLIDFGFAHKIAEGIPETTSGERLHCAPEEKQTAKSDIFSFGVTALEIFGVDLKDIHVKLRKDIIPFNSQEKLDALVCSMKHYFNHHPEIQDKQTREELIRFFALIFSDDPNERPSLEEIQDIIGQLYNALYGEESETEDEYNISGSPIVSDSSDSEESESEEDSENFSNEEEDSNYTSIHPVSTTPATGIGTMSCLFKPVAVRPSAAAIHQENIERLIQERSVKNTQ